MTLHVMPASAPATTSTSPAAIEDDFGWRRIGLFTGVFLLTPIVLAAIAPDLVAPYDPMANSAPALSPPSAAHPLGTDDLGRDLLSMVIAGARGTLLIGFIATFLSIILGTAVGLVAGYLGGLIDEAMMRATEFVKILPRFLVALLVATLFGPSLTGLSLVLGLMSWPGLARMVRAETVVQREREHVVAARALGCSSLDIMRRHILPAAARPALAVIAPVATGAILAEAGLGYLGLSDPATVSWGDLIRNGQAFYAHGWWLSIFPGTTIVLTCLGLALVLEGIGRSARAT
ncbi:MAG: ABC transporter permease [Inquilinaceae bacterium]